MFSYLKKQQQKTTRCSNSKLTPLIENYNVLFLFSLGRVPDDRTINEILRPYIDPEKSDPVIRQRYVAKIS